MKISKKFRYLGACLVMILVAACGQATPAYDDAYTIVSQPTALLSTMPEPSGEVILTIKGDIAQTNVGDELQFDLDMIESVGVVEYSLGDPFEERQVTYRGVLMRDMLAAAGIAAKAKTLKITALNDYAIEIPVAEFDEYPIMMALQADGEYRQPDYRGPSMLVYPLHAYDNFDMNRVQDNWIWQIKTFEIF